MNIKNKILKIFNERENDEKQILDAENIYYKILNKFENKYNDH